MSSEATASDHVASGRGFCAARWTTARASATRLPPAGVVPVGEVGHPQLDPRSGARALQGDLLQCRGVVDARGADVESHDPLGAGVAGQVAHELPAGVAQGPGDQDRVERACHRLSFPPAHDAARAVARDIADPGRLHPGLLEPHRQGVGLLRRDRDQQTPRGLGVGEDPLVDLALPLGPRDVGPDVGAGCRGIRRAPRRPPPARGPLRGPAPAPRPGSRPLPTPRPAPGGGRAGRSRSRRCRRGFPRRTA